MSLETICEWCGISRQAHYQMQQRQQQAEMEAEMVLVWVREIRHWHPRMGARKLYHKLKEKLMQAEIQMGRDRLFDLLRQHDLLVRRRRRQHRTTIPGLKRAENLLEDLAITQPDQVWVSDITYVTTERGFHYLFLITDAFSRRIMGWELSPSLAAEGALAALDQAIATAQGPLQGLIHHSDRGCQYTSIDYLLRLQATGARPSMGEKGNCYDNALAERINGILKIEYGLDGCFVNFAQARQATQQAIMLYNQDRPHLALHYHTPVEVYCRHLHSPNP